MIATLLIYVAGLALLVLAGVALLALLDPRGRWLTPATPAAGAAGIVCLAHFAGYFLAGSATAIVVVVVAAALVVLGVVRRGRPRELRAAFAVSGAEALALGLGALVGLVFLTPVLAIGFPTTIAGEIADGWARAVLAEWLIDNPLRDSITPTGADRPIGTYSDLPPHLGAGFEYLVATMSTLLGRRAYETALPVATLSAPIAMGGWTWLHALIADRRPRAWQVAVLALATVSPLFVLPLGENYLTQCLSLALWPFAMAATLAFLRAPGIASAVLAAAGLAAAASVYPQLIPFIAPPAGLLVLVAARHERLSRPVAIVAASAALGVALLVVAPIELWRAYKSVTLFQGVLGANPGFPLFQAEQDLQLVLGGISQYSMAPTGPGPEIWLLIPSVALMLAVVAVGAMALWTMAARERWPLLALVAGVGAITLVLYVKYKFGDDYGYGTYKALVSGGALLGGLLALALASGTAAWRPGRLAAAGVALAVWASTTSVILQHQRYGLQGFRETERAAIDRLQALPASDVVLVDGAAENDFSFKLRLTAGYVAAATEGRKLEGLGSTSSYFTGGGGDEWRPQRAWRYVLASDAPSAFTAGRRTIWRAPPYRLQEAPELDVTQYVPPGQRFWVTPTDADAGSTDQIAGPVEVIVSNRGAQPANAQLELELEPLEPGRSLTLSADGGEPREVRFSGEQPRSVRYPVTVPAGGTARVTLDPGEPATGEDGKPVPLFSLTGVRAR
jgi:hypothetical protein